MGQGAGAGVVHLLALSEKSEGLFHKYVTQSGSAEMPWAYRPKEKAVKTSMEFAASVNCTGANNQKIVDCLRVLSASINGDNSTEVNHLQSLDLAKNYWMFIIIILFFLFSNFFFNLFFTKNLIAIFLFSLPFRQCGSVAQLFIPVVYSNSGFKFAWWAIKQTFESARSGFVRTTRILVT